MTTATVVVALFFPAGEILDVTDKLNDMFALGGIDHLTAHDFLGVIIAGGAVADMNGQFRLAANGIGRGFHL